MKLPTAVLIFYMIPVLSADSAGAEAANEKLVKRLHERFRITPYIYSAYSEEECSLYLKIMKLKCQKFCNYLLCCRKNAYIQENLQVAELELAKVQWLHYPQTRNKSGYPMYYEDLTRK